MREQRRRRPRTVSPLEILDDRIVPSAVGMAPRPHAALAEHSIVQQRMQHSTQMHHLRRPRLHLRSHAHHARAHFQAQPVPGGPMSLASSASAGATAQAMPPAFSITPGAMPQAFTVSTGPMSQALPSMASVSMSAVPTAPVSAGGTRAIVPGQAGAVTSATTTPTTTPTIDQIKNGPMAKAGQDLITISLEFQAQGGSPTFTSSKAGLVEIRGTNVGVNIRSVQGDFNNFVAKLKGLGMQIQSQDPKSGTVAGLLPIAQIAAVAGDAQTQSMSAVYIPQTRSASMGLSMLR